jgi:hypothetical protein
MFDREDADNMFLRVLSWLHGVTSLFVITAAKNLKFCFLPLGTM